MNDTEITQKYQTAYSFLNGKGIMELRSYGRAFGVQAPTTKRKQDLIVEIIKMAAGIESKTYFSRRGAKVRAKPIADGEVKELIAMLSANRESQPKKNESREIPLRGKPKLYSIYGELKIRGDGSFNLSIEGEPENTD